MRALPLFLLVVSLALAGCSSGPEEPSGESGGTSPTPTAGSPSHDASSPPTPTPTSAPPPAANTTPPEAREVRRSFDLSVVDSRGSSVSVGPLLNCVAIDSSSGTRIHDGSAKAAFDDGAQLSDMELRFDAKDAKASVRGILPLVLAIPPANATNETHATVTLQLPDDAPYASAVKAKLDLVLQISGAEPSFAVQGCRFAG